MNKAVLFSDYFLFITNCVLYKEIFVSGKNERRIVILMFSVRASEEEK